MKANTAKRFGALMALLVVAQLIALPTARAAVKGTASIAADQRVIFAGEPQSSFTVSVSNPAVLEGGTPLNNVRIDLPRAQFRVLSVSPPEGWNLAHEITADTNTVVFETSSLQSRILPGQSADFGVTAVLQPVPNDLARQWTVAVSDNGGLSSATQTPASAGALTTTLRVLRVIGVALQGDPLVTDNTVTAGQGPVTLRATVENAASAPLTVTTDLSGLADSTSVSPGPQVVPANDIGNFDYQVTFGSPGSRTPTVDANALLADGFPLSGAAIGVQSPIDATYAVNSLQPRDVVPGQSYGFALTLAKTGDVAGTINTGNFSFAGGLVSTDLAEASAVSGGNQNRGLLFQEVEIPPTMLDGLYPPSLTITGTDSNGWPFSVSPAITDSVRLDSTLPVVLPALSVPAPAVGDDPATTDGGTLSFGGTVYEADGETVCANCTVAAASLRQFDIDGVELASIPVNVTINNGNLGGSYSGNYDPAAVETLLAITANKATGAGASGESDRLDVDNIAPAFKEAVTGGVSGDNRRRIDITLNEAVTSASGLALADWSVEDNRVDDVAVNGNVITLTLANDLAGDSEPEVEYHATALSGRHQDRVSKDLADGTIPAVDGILPGVPLVEQVDGKDKQDGSFYINVSEPAVLVGNLGDGQTVSLFEDVNEDGTIDVGDRLLARETAQDDSIVLTTADLGTADREVTILGLTVDGRGNESAGISTDTLVLDFTLPAALEVLIQGDDVTISFGEPIVAGRDNTNDWTVFGPSAATGDEQAFVPTAVTGSGASRSLSFDDVDYDQQVSEIVYNYLGPAAERYRDRAGNPMPNFSLIP